LALTYRRTRRALVVAKVDVADPDPIGGSLVEASLLVESSPGHRHTTVADDWLK
jgi:hypothetical protein